MYYINKRKLSFLLFSLLLLLMTACNGEKPMKMNQPHNIKGVANCKKVFNDLNDKHLGAAQAIGIPLVESREAAEKMKRKLVELNDTDLYRVDKLTHSIPYLVPRAAKLLNRIGENFLDSLECKGLNPYKVIVTSVLRTQTDVKKLRRSNGNASENSAHCHGTTFDISYVRYAQVPDSDGAPMEPVPDGKLKAVLSEVLRDLKANGSCYVKYEVKQGCFHITARR